ncbi:MAG: ABC-2 family transporter protein [Gemmataceae bacterium]
MTGPGRYLRLLLAFARFGLATEMSFRANFLVKLTVEILWLGILLVFYDLIFRQTEEVAGWDRWQYFFFVGCHYALGGLIETFFLENCTNFAELVRSGDLDLYLLKPIDEQFLISTRHVDWATFPNILQGAGVMVFALWAMHWPLDVGRIAGFLVLFACGCAMAYSFLLMLSSMSVWMVRNQSLMEMWWLFTTLMRYPREIFRTTAWANPVGWFFTFIIPVLLVVNVPATTMVRSLEPGFVILMVVATVVLLFASRAVFRYSLASYRSASS